MLTGYTESHNCPQCMSPIPTVCVESEITNGRRKVQIACPTCNKGYEATLLLMGGVWILDGRVYSLAAEKTRDLLRRYTAPSTAA